VPPDRRYRLMSAIDRLHAGFTGTGK